MVQIFKFLQGVEILTAKILHFLLGSPFLDFLKANWLKKLKLF